MTRSLQSKLMLWIGVTIASVLLMAGIVLYFFVHRALQSEFDASLNQACLSIAYLVESDGVKIESEMAEKELPRYARSDNPDLYQLFDQNRRPVESSSGLNDSSLSLVDTPLNQSSIQSVELPDGRSGRSVAFKFIPKFEPSTEGDHDEHESDNTSKDDRYEDQLSSSKLEPLTLVVARDTIELDQTLSRIRWLIVIVTAMAILIGIFLSAVVARLGLSSLRTATDRIASIDGNNFDELFDAAQLPVEVQPMMAALQDMQSRLKVAFDRERQFSANVAHELRTPLAGMKGMMEVTATKKRTPEEYEVAIGKCVAVCKQTEAIVDNLFTLASVDSEQCPLKKEIIDLPHFIRLTWQSFAKEAEQRGLKTDWQLDESLQIQADRVKSGLLLRNLFENAVSYADPNTLLEIKCSSIGQWPNHDRIRIEVSNSTTQLVPSDIPKMFDRFWRGDESRSQTGHHSGLGLALCRSLTHLLGGTIDAKLSKANRFTIFLELPVVEN